ncbi:MAG: hypothetical protein R3F54_22850 [Alphaproteobacteria bacterium]
MPIGISQPLAAKHGKGEGREARQREDEVDGVEHGAPPSSTTIERLAAEGVKAPGEMPVLGVKMAFHFYEEFMRPAALDPDADTILAASFVPAAQALNFGHQSAGGCS